MTGPGSGAGKTLADVFRARGLADPEDQARRCLLFFAALTREPDRVEPDAETAKDRPARAA